MGRLWPFVHVQKMSEALLKNKRIKLQRVGR